MSKRRTVFSTVNIVPYLDVMLVLLVIFMATTPVVQTGVNLDLPQGQASSVMSNNAVVVSIDKTGKRFVQIGDGVVQGVNSKAELSKYLLKNKIPYTSTIQLYADRALSWQIVLTTLQEVTSFGWSKVALMTEDTESFIQQNT